MRGSLRDKMNATTLMVVVIGRYEDAVAAHFHESRRHSGRVGMKTTIKTHMTTTAAFRHQTKRT